MTQVLLSLLLGLLGQAQPVPLTFAWDLDSSHDQEIVWEVEADGQTIVPCGPVVVTASGRRCPTQVPASASVFRVRGRTTTDIGAWSEPASLIQIPGIYTVIHAVERSSPPDPKPKPRMAITVFGSVSNPTTPGSNNTSPAAVTPPVSMATGDLVVFVGVAQSTTGTMSVSEAGGQTWNSRTQKVGGGMTSQVFWCRFDGTWDADPSLAFDGTTTNGFSAIMHVFRPTDGANTWGVDVSEVQTDIPGGSTTITVTGINRLTSGALALAIWTVDDDAAWSNMTGSGWSTLGDLSHRNTAGNDLGVAMAYNIGDGATNDASKDTNATGATGHTWILAFKEIAGGGGAATFRSRIAGGFIVN